MLMAQLYSKKTSNHEQLIPRQETIKFLLNYSKSLHIVSFGTTKFDCILN